MRVGEKQSFIWHNLPFLGVLQFIMWTEYHFQELLHRGKVFTVSYISVKKCYRMLSCRCFRWVFRVWGVKVPVKRFLIVKKNNYYFRIPAIVLENIGIKLNQTICLNFGFLGVPEDSNNFLCVIWNQSNAFYSSPSDSLLFAQIRETIYFPTETRDVLLIKFVIPQSKNFFSTSRWLSKSNIPWKSNILGRGNEPSN